MAHILIEYFFDSFYHILWSESEEKQPSSREQIKRRPEAW
jgi:hypothetical protein